MPAALDGLIPRYTYTQRIRGLNEALARTRYIGEYASNIRGGFLVVYIVSALFVSVFGKLRTVELWAVLVSELVVFAAGVWWSYRWKPKYVVFVEQEMERFTAFDVGVGVTWESVRIGNGFMYSLSGSEAVVHVPWKIVVKRKMADGVGEDGVEAEGAGEFLPAYSLSLSVLGTSSSESNVIGGRALPKYEDV
ncbi:hypothetical protein BCR33DRAFT_717312 [Rhizoclosmatium globosum]|uniref:Uncharacterized protein n=1 Tax=Rhizoclosmatium globosum TaxID=329046 RepID=A0A1Y2C9B9_9FUNG|nr:hypothetical protein BCR33DRAFT_717312 [Rhizoclosmatium globosum]|eukprot:ORY43630.1 hypothetical protein BCR33DRAFT_717312 [Rhizoclosmatium globosum]